MDNVFPDTNDSLREYRESVLEQVDPKFRAEVRSRLEAKYPIPDKQKEPTTEKVEAAAKR